MSPVEAAHLIGIAAALWGAAALQLRALSAALGVALVSAALSLAPLPPAHLRLVALLPPAALVSAVWATLRARAGLGVALGVAQLSLAAAAVSCPLTRAQLGDTYAAIWIVAILLGAAACYLTQAALHSSRAAVALLAGLGPEAVAWIAWGRGVEGAYSIARAASLVSLGAVVCVLLGEVRWRWTDSDPGSVSPPPPG